MIEHGGRRSVGELEKRRQSLIDTRLARMGELAAARGQVESLQAEITRLEGGIIEVNWLLGPLSGAPKDEEPPDAGRVTDPGKIDLIPQTEG